MTSVMSFQSLSMIVYFWKCIFPDFVQILWEHVTNIKRIQILQISAGFCVRQIESASVKNMFFIILLIITKKARIARLLLSVHDCIHTKR